MAKFIAGAAIGTMAGGVVGSLLVCWILNQCLMYTRPAKKRLRYTNYSKPYQNF